MIDPSEPTPRRVADSLALGGFIGLCLLVGAAGGAITADSVRGWYLTLVHPPGVPPSSVFPPVWTTLYVMIGAAGWLAWRRMGTQGIAARRALLLWGCQLLANALWTPAFFGLHNPALGLVVLAALLPLIVLALRALWTLDRRAGVLMAPYLLWSLYATYLNVGFWWLNP